MIVDALLNMSARKVNVVIAVGCAGLMVFALYLQQKLGLHPCPLCITQRVCVITVGVVAMFAALHNPGKTGVRVCAALQGLAAMTGIGVAGRHVWIQNLPADQVPACGPGLKYMFESFPFMEALEILFKGDGNCAVVDWTFLSLSIPAWVLVACVILLVANLWQMFRQ